MKRQPRQDQGWFSWNLEDEREKKAAGLRAAIQAAYPGGAAMWMSRVDAPGPNTDAGRARAALCLAVDAAWVKLCALPRGGATARAVWSEEWWGRPLVEEEPVDEGASEDGSPEPLGADDGPGEVMP